MAKRARAKKNAKSATIVSQSVIVVTVLSDGEMNIRSLGEGLPNAAEEYADQVVHLLRTIEENPVKASERTATPAGQWISVSDRVPSEHDRVLVFDPSIPKFGRKHNEIAIGAYRGPGFLAGPWFVPDGTEPTHWMPLPSAPDFQSIKNRD